jgi:hypothetical protein
MLSFGEGATFEAVSDARFLMPHSAKDPQTAPWCGEEHTATSYEVMLMEESGLFRPGTIIDKPGAENDPNNWSKLKAWVNTATWELPTSRRERSSSKIRKRHSRTPLQYFPNTIDWQEIWCAFDVDGSRKPKEICVHYPS